MYRTSESVEIRDAAWRYHLATKARRAKARACAVCLIAAGLFAACWAVL